MQRHVVFNVKKYIKGVLLALIILLLFYYIMVTCLDDHVNLASKVVFEKQDINISIILNNIKRGYIHELYYYFKNEGTEIITIGDIKTTCGLETVRCFPSKTTFKQNESGYIKVLVPIPVLISEVNDAIYIYDNNGYEIEDLTFTIKVHYKDIACFAPEEINLQKDTTSYIVKLLICDDSLKYYPKITKLRMPNGVKLVDGTWNHFNDNSYVYEMILSVNPILIKECKSIIFANILINDRLISASLPLVKTYK